MSSKTNLAENALQARLRDKLNGENVKLWLEPFFDASSKITVDSEIMALASRYAMEIEYAEDEVVECLYTLQRNALERLAERDLYKETGLSTIRLKLSGFQNPPSSTTTTSDSTAPLRLQVDLQQMNGKDLKKEIASTVHCNENQLKLICHGRVINENQVLEHQNVKNGAQVMVLFIPVTHEDYQESEDNFRQIEETKDSANYLAGHSAGGNAYSLQVADQSGKSLDLPEAEKKALAVALALHEKGRSSLKSLDFSKALVFLLEADSYYNQCQSSLLERVDNYGILNLDIAWCYLALQSIVELPAVETRLKQCEKSLKRSYGENLERVVALKGSTGWEAALFVRLHLLQGIAAYHQGHIERSKFLIGQVEEELSRLRVSDDQLAQMINMGYSTEESRVALRATYGNIPAAVDFIVRKREEQAEIRKQEKEDRHRRKLQKKLGVCDNGDAVNSSLWRNLKEMGFNAAVALDALKRANNDINAALQLVNDMDFITQVVTSNTDRPVVVRPPPPESTTESDPPAGPSTNALSSSSSVIDDLELARTLASLESHLLADSPSEDRLTAEEMERSQKAYDVLSKDVSSESDYIDLDLSAENTYINRYKELLRM